VILVAKREIGIIKPGMQFVFVCELEYEIHTYCTDLKMDFKLNKNIINENFDIYYR